MRIAIIGAGAMGSLFGARLSTAAEVWLVDPWAEHVAAMQREGLLLIRPDGSELRVSVQAVRDPAAVPRPVDLAIVFVKSHSTRWAAEQAAPILADNGLALTLQNGLGNLEVIAEVVGAARAVQGVTAQGATLLGPGRVRHAGQGPTHLASRPETAEKVAALADLFNAAGLETHVSGNLDSLIWGKLVINCGINALTAILRVPNDVLAQEPHARALMAAAAQEAAAVAQAQGIVLPYEDPAGRTIEVAIATGQNRSSMLQDVLRGAPTEIEVINGAVVREGGRLGVAVPVNRLLAQLVRALEGSRDQRI